MYVPNLKSVALPVPEIIGGSQKSGQPLSPGYAHTPYFQKFYKSSIQIIPILCALVSPQFPIGVLSGGCDPLILGKRRVQGVGDGTIRKSVDKFL